MPATATQRESLKCPMCEGEIDLTAPSCTTCGTPLPELALVRCAACGETNSPEAVDCRQCREILTDKSPEARRFTRTFIGWLKDAGYKADVVRGIPCYVKGSALILIINEELQVSGGPIHIMRFRANVVRKLEDPRRVGRTLLKANSSLILGSFGLDGNCIVYRYDWVTTEVTEELFLVIAGMIADIVDSTDDYLAEMTGGETALGNNH